MSIRLRLKQTKQQVILNTSNKVKKVKVTLEQAMKVKNGSRAISHSSTLPSTSVLDGVGRSTTRPGRFTPGKDPVPIV